MRPQEASSNSLRRPVIGLFGEMNAGKSTIMNALTQQTTAIVDKTPGTTADVKTALLQMHGLGPCKVRNDRTPRVIKVKALSQGPGNTLKVSCVII